MKMKPKKTNLHPKALLYKRFTNIEQGLSTNSIYRTDTSSSGKYNYWCFEPNTQKFVEILKGTNIEIVEMAHMAGSFGVVDTQYKPTTNTKMIFEFIISTGLVNPSGFLLGCNPKGSSATYTNNTFGVEYGNVEDTIKVWFFGQQFIFPCSSSIQLLKIKLTVDKNGIIFETNAGQKIVQNFVVSQKYIDMNNLTIFGLNVNDLTDIREYASGFDFLSLQLFENNVLQKNLLPARELISGEAYFGVLYDTINNAVFPNLNEETSSLNYSNPLYNVDFENAKIIDITTRQDVLKYKDKYFYFNDNYYWVEIDKSLIADKTLSNIISVKSSKYQINTYYYVGSFDYTQKGSSTETTTQYLKGNIIPLTSMNIVTYNDDLNFKKDDLCVVGEHLFFVEEVEHEHKQMPKDFYIHYLTLNSIL